MRRKSKASSATAAASRGTTRARRTTFGLACLCVLGLAAFSGSGAPSVGAAESFPGQGFLPDNRAWEMVSPPSKNGGEVMPSTFGTRAAVDGDAVAYRSLSGFGDAHGLTIATDYLAERTGASGTNGWGTHSIFPKQPANDYYGAAQGGDSLYQGEMSADLSRGVYRSLRPLEGVDPGNSGEMMNLYVRDDLRTPGPGHYLLASDAVAPPLAGFPLALRSPIRVGNKPYLASTSADFSKIVFDSALELLPGTALGGNNLYESEHGVVRLVGMVPPSGETECGPAPLPACEPTQARTGGHAHSFPGGFYSPHMVSADGSRVFFQALDSVGNVYARIDGERTIQLNTSERQPAETPRGASLFDASVDGNRVFFSSGEKLIDGVDQSGLYMYDFIAPEGERLTLVSEDEEPADGINPDIGNVIGASEDGRSVYYLTRNQLVAGEPLFPATASSVGGIFVWREGTVAYVGSFTGSGTDSTINLLNGAAWDGSFSRVISNQARITPDGRHLLFMMQGDEGLVGRGGYTGYDSGNSCTFDNSLGLPCREFYVYSADSGRIQCASCNPSGATATVEAFVNILELGSNSSPNSHLGRNLSSDGRYVFFSSAEALVKADTNGVSDAYEYDTLTEEPRLLSSGEDAAPSYFMDASADGHDAFFVTRERLSGWDVDTSYDLYDARIGGGLPEPQPAPPACQGDACQPPPPALNDPTPASSTYHGPGNRAGIRKRAHCSKGSRKVKGRCVKRKANATKHRRAGAERRMGK